MNNDYMRMLRSSIEAKDSMRGGCCGVGGAMIGYMGGAMGGKVPYKSKLLTEEQFNKKYGDKGIPSIRGTSIGYAEYIRRNDLRKLGAKATRIGVAEQERLAREDIATRKGKDPNKIRLSKEDKCMIRCRQSNLTRQMVRDYKKNNPKDTGGTAARTFAADPANRARFQVFRPTRGKLSPEAKKQRRKVRSDLKDVAGISLSDYLKGLKLGYSAIAAGKRPSAKQEESKHQAPDSPEPQRRRGPRPVGYGLDEEGAY